MKVEETRNSKIRSTRFISSFILPSPMQQDSHYDFYFNDDAHSPESYQCPLADAQSPEADSHNLKETPFFEQSAGNWDAFDLLIRAANQFEQQKHTVSIPIEQIIQLQVEQNLIEKLERRRENARKHYALNREKRREQMRNYQRNKRNKTLK
jgi:hypothetical protein